jgi:heme exporter protein D
VRKIESKYLLIFVLLIGMSFVGCASASENDFQVDAIFLKNMIKQSESVSNNLRVTSLGEEGNTFYLRVEGIEELVNLSDRNFDLASGDSKDVTVGFYGNGFAPGVYVGRVVVESDLDKAIPVILEIQSEDVLFATNLDVAPKYKEVFQGGNIAVSTRLFNLNDTFLHDVEMSYMVKSFGGETIVSEVETTIVGTEVSVSKNIVLPLDIDFGDYAFIVVSKFEDSVSTSSYLFSVVEEEEEGSFFMGDFGFFALIIVAFLAGIVVLIIYLIYERNQMFNELRRQNRSELRMCMGVINEKKKVTMAKAKTGAARREVGRRFVRAKSVAVRELKSRHKKQRKEFRKLIRHNKKGLMKKKMSEWKKQGFKFGNEISKMKFSEKGRGDQMSKWKKQGFKV